MAGIGFALNKVLKEKELTSAPKAFAYASIVTVGPLLLGVMVLISVYLLAYFSQVMITDRNLIVAIITYGLLASLLVYSLASLVISRYLSDNIYVKKIDGIISTFWGSQIFLLIIGGLLYALFLLFSGLGFAYSVLAWLLFCELLLTWNTMSFLTIIKDYVSIFKAFLLTIVITVLTAVSLILINCPIVFAILIGIVSGYAAFLLLTITVLYRQFPNKIKANKVFDFIRYFDDFKELAIIGFSTQLGLVGHIIIIWFSPIAQQVKGLFYIAPYYDLTVFLASLTMLPTTIGFMVSVEVDFFKSYRQFFQSLDSGADLHQLKKAEGDMVDTLLGSLKKTVWVQLVITLLAVSIGTVVLRELPLGFNYTMSGYFRFLCIAYAIYGIANIISLSTMYFNSYEITSRSSLLFAFSSLIATIAIIQIDSLLYGFGFLIASALFFIKSVLDLEKTSGQILYQVLGKQPLAARVKEGYFYRLANSLNGKAEMLMKKKHLRKD